jgi:iron complex transport system ATP-binding protein
MSAILNARALCYAIGADTLIDGVSLSLSAGETVALVGPNGAGKSTLLRLLSGELAPRSGAIELHGRALGEYAPRQLAEHRAVLAQHVNVAFPFTVTEVVRMGAGDRRGRAIDHLVEAALAEVDLGAFRDRIINTLSGGEQQRAHLARVLVQLACGEAEHGPGLLMLDEPTASLDLRHQLDLLNVSRRCAGRGISVLAVLHDLNLAALFARRIVVLDRGRVVCDGTPAETITDDTLRRVFKVSSAVGRVPAADMPFVLPHAMHAAAPPAV